MAFSNELLEIVATWIFKRAPVFRKQPIFTEPIKPPTYLTDTRPDPLDWEGGTIYVSDASSGSKMQFSDGSSWVALG